MTLMMISGFLLIISLGHLYCGIFVLCITSSMYREIIQLKRRKDKDERVYAYVIDWYYYGVFAFFMIPKFFFRRILTETLIQ
jgi:CDP-diglyceride synthetase